MRRPATRLNRASRRRFGVLACWLLSLLAGCDLGVLDRILHSCRSFAIPTACAQDEEEEPIEDERDMLLSRTVCEMQREQRKQQETSGGLFLDDGRCWRTCFFACFISQKPSGRSGGEHAFRNGVGVPLLC